ncbi:MerR family transcriptional regulator [Nocardia neocaledoniensis NBRC 108232]|uniref:Excisionase family DNA binding protein n=1 Tax=Nocardia neocaledoniensis TaxID=236511 RepID=A0A317N9N9_9NOCA|nr:helix-turn-helix domain-containing protein [Nocardia neocaledoniensis]PWV71633.1 excisionase family DNA binding protein [Nocardia neocaledoniensis]GEM29181.1 MerR family transcriptional regulator [Nocardia neocaledoniensis NBRC 108232]
MTDRLYSVEQVAELLGLHVRTVRSYVRDGKLPAARIGKQYRIAHDDLEAFTGLPLTSPPPATDQADVSCIVEIDAVDRTTADRITTLLTATAATRGPGGRALRVETGYDPGRSRLKVIVLGGLADTARLLDYMDGVLSS